MDFRKYQIKPFVFPIIIGLVVLSVFLNTFLANEPETVQAQTSLDKTGTLWSPYLEWSLDNPTFSGNAFDVLATATFIHPASGETRTTEMFYDGGTTWKFRFTGTRTGQWTATTASSDPELDGHSGMVTINANPDSNIKGFITSENNKFARQTTSTSQTEGFLFNVFMDWVDFPTRVSLSSFLSQGHVDGYLDTAQQNGFDVVFVDVVHAWLQLGTLAYTDHSSEDPDPQTFRILENIVTSAHKRGMSVHFWAWGDERRKWTPVGLTGGINGPVDQRLQRYIAARLGPLPGWTMGYGFDLQEWVTEPQVGKWAEYMHQHLGWDHLLMGRGRFHPELDVNSYSFLLHPYSDAVNNLDSDISRPHFFEERDLYLRQSQHTMDWTRQHLWRYTLAGGHGGFWGRMWSGGPKYPNPEQLRTHNRFWKGEMRFLLGMQRANSLTDGFALKDAANQNYIFYKENASSIQMDLSGMNGSQSAVAVDTKLAYAEVNLGIRTAANQTWTAPYPSDWAVAVGSFGGSTSASVDKWRRHVVSLPNSTYSGNPFELEVDATFTHPDTGITLTLPGYYAGSNTWKLGFMPTETGMWTYTTISSDPDLNRVTGSLNVVDAGLPGMLKADPANPKKWKFTDGDYVVPLAFRMDLFTEDGSSARIIEIADFLKNNVNGHMLEGRLTRESGSPTFPIFQGSPSNHQFHLANWDRFEQRLEILAERGLGFHVMFYSDDGGTPSWAGQSATEQLLIRYVIARTAGYPVMMYNTGVDIAEYRDQAWINWFGQQIRNLDPYGHPVSSRYGGGSGAMVMSGQTFDSRGDRLAIINDMTSYFSSSFIPVSMDDAWSENSPAAAARGKDFTENDIRRAAWKAVMAGGTGVLMRGTDEIWNDAYFRINDPPQFGVVNFEDDLESEGFLSLVNPFIASKLGNTYGSMVSEPSLVTNGYALADPARIKILYFLMGRNDRYDSGNGGNITLRLSGISKNYDAVWFNPRTGAETSAGTVNGGADRTLAPPSTDDWVLLLAEALASSRIQLNPATTYQTMTRWTTGDQAANDVFWFPDWPLYKDKLMDEAVNDLGLNSLILGIPSGKENTRDFDAEFKAGIIDQATLRGLGFTTVNDNADPNVIDFNGFQFAELDMKIETIALPMKQRVEANGEKFDLNLLYVAFTKSNAPGTEYHHTDPQEYAEFILATSLHIRNKYGIDVDTWEFLLEPDNSTRFANREDLIAQAVLAAITKLEANGFTPKFILPSTLSMSQAPVYFNNIKINLGGGFNIGKYIDSLSYHRYAGQSAANAQAIGNLAASNGIGAYMSEWIGADYSTLHQDLKLANNTTWNQFVLAFPTVDNGAQYYVIDDSIPGSPKVNIGSRTKFLRQYFKFIRKGAVRIDATSNNGSFDPVAFINADGKNVVVVKASAKGTFSIQGLAPAIYGIKYTTNAQYDVDLTDQTISSGQAVTTNIPASGVITIYAKAGGMTPTDTTPPILSNARPSGTLAAGTTQATLQLTTNENAACRYATAAGTAYSSMTNTFSTTGGISHSSVVSGLGDGRSYTYYARCRDTSGNANTGDTTIQFSVAASSSSPPNLVAYWPFDDGAGSSTAADRVAGNNGTLQNMEPATDWAAGSPPLSGGTALDFDGVNEDVRVPAAPELNLSGDKITLALWINGDDVNAGGVVIDKGAWHLRLFGTTARLHTSTTSGGKQHNVSFPWQNNRWYHFAGVYDGSTMRIFIDGVEIGSPTSQTGALTDSSSNDLRIGSRGGNYFNGRIDDVRVYDSALSAAQIAGVMKGDPAITSLAKLHLFLDGLKTITIMGSNFSVTDDFRFRMKNSSGAIRIDVPVRPTTSTTVVIDLVALGVTTSGLTPGFYAIELERVADGVKTSTSATFVVTRLGDLWSSTATSASKEPRDGKIDIHDVSRMLSKFGSTVAADVAEADINAGPGGVSSGKIDIFDANKLMANWTG